MDEYLMRVSLCGDKAVESFRSHRTQMELRELPLNSFYVAGAANSGPIALLYRKHGEKQIKLPGNYQESILLFDCKGQLLRTQSFDLRERIILFEFTHDEHLLIVYANGRYFLLDTATSQLHEDSYWGETDQKFRCRGGQLVSNQVVLLRDRTLGMAQDVRNKWQSFKDIHIHPENSIFQAAPGPPGTILVLYLTRNYEIGLSQIDTAHPADRTNRILFRHSELQLLSSLLIKLSYQDNKLVLVFTQFLLEINCSEQLQEEVRPSRLTISQNSLTKTSLEKLREMFLGKIVLFDFNIELVDPFCQTKTQNKYRNFYCVGWLGPLFYFSDRKRLFFTTGGHICSLVEESSSFCLAQGNNILRVIGDFTFVYRQVSDPIYLYLSGQTAVAEKLLEKATPSEYELFGHFRQLLKFYEGAVEKRANELQNLIELREKVGRVIEGVVEGAKKSMDVGSQLKMLRMAQWSQSIFGVAGDRKELVGRLRVVNGLKYEHLSRWLSFEEFEELRNERFLAMLLRSNMHFVGDLIFEDSQSKEKIFLHWGKCKIERETTLTAIQHIQQRYTAMKRDLQSKFVFTNLAMYSLRRSPPLQDLALRLAEHQEHPTRKCLVYLLAFQTKPSLDRVDKLLDFAEQSLSPPAMHRTLQILRQLQAIPNRAWLQLLPKRPFLEQLYLRILSLEGNEESSRELQEYMGVTKRFTDLAFYSLAGNLKNQSFQASCKLVQTDYSKLLPSLSAQLGRCLPKKNIGKLRKLKEKKGAIVQEDGEGFEKEGDFEFLGELAANRDGNWALAFHFWRKMSSGKVFDILRGKGRIRECMELAVERREREVLESLVNELGEQDESRELGQKLLEEWREER